MSIDALASGRSQTGRFTVEEWEVDSCLVQYDVMTSVVIGSTLSSTNVIIYVLSPGEEEGMPVTVPRMETLVCGHRYMTDDWSGKGSGVDVLFENKPIKRPPSYGRLKVVEVLLCS